MYRKPNILLEIKNLTINRVKNKQSVNILDDINFYVLENEILGLFGEPNCGKELIPLSLFNLIKKPFKSENGSISYKKIEINNLSKKQFKKYFNNEIIMINNNPVEFFNIKTSIKTQFSNFSITRIIENFREVSLTNAISILNKYPNELTFSELLKIQIAKILSYNPTLLILNEPESYINKGILDEIIILLGKLKEKYKFSILLTTYDINIATYLCDRVVILCKNKIIEIVSKDSISSKYYRHPISKELFRQILQVPIYKKDVTHPNQYDKLIKSNKSVSGCLAHPFCYYRLEICDKVEPRLTEIDENIFIACHLYDPKYKDSPKYSR